MPLNFCTITVHTFANRPIAGINCFAALLSFIVALSSASPASGNDPGHLDPPPTKMMAVTIDDVPLNGPDLPLPQLQAMTDRLTDKLRMAHVPAIGFVNEKQLFDKKGEVDARIALLETWLASGLELGNHTFSHPNLQTMSLNDFEDDIVRGETITSALLKARGKRLEYFRYPFLNTGSDANKKKAVEKFLSERHYTNAPVTVDAQDWWFAPVYAKAKSYGDDDTANKIAEEYLAYTSQKIAYSEQMSNDVNGRPMRQILMLHCSLLNADQFEKLAKVIEAHGYKFVPLNVALHDPAYSRVDDYAGDEGITWLERWLLSERKSASRPCPPPPKFVEDLYKDLRYKE